MSPRATPVTPAAVRARAAARYARSATAWAAAAEVGRPVPAPVMELPLHPPTESAALAGPDAVIAWVRSWQANGVPGQVSWQVRSWPAVGRQQIPVRVRLDTTADVAHAAGRSPHWQRLTDRCRQLAAGWPADGGLEAALTRHGEALTVLDDADMSCLVGVLTWLVQHPHSDLYPRQLPVRGVHSKWLDQHQTLVRGLVVAATGQDELGLSAPPSLTRVLVLDPRLRPGGLRDLAAPATDLKSWDVRPDRVIIVENLQSLLPLPDAPGVVAVHGGGAAVDVVTALPWVRGAEVTYWGDLDSHGLAILDRARIRLPEARSVLMDVGTLHAYRDLCVVEPVPSVAEMPRLTGDEQALRTELAVLGQLRLEQERIPWDVCLARLGLRSA